MNVTQASMRVNFSIMKANETDTYLGDVKENVVTETQLFEKSIQGIENLDNR